MLPIIQEKNILIASAVVTIRANGGSGNSEKCRKAFETVFDYGISNGQNKTNYVGKINRYSIKRYTVNRDMSSEEMKAMIDTLISENTGWIIWMVHTSSGEFQQEFADILSDSIDYALKNSVEIVTTKTGVQTYVN